MSTFVISGTSRGIGLELVKQLLTLPVTQVSHVFAITRTASTEAFLQLPSDRLTNIIIPNLSDAHAVAKGVRQVEKALNGKPLDVLINNAGTMPITTTSGGEHTGKTQDVPVQQLMETLDANVGTVLAMTAGFLPLLLKTAGDGSSSKGKKQIFNISSTLGSMAFVKTYSHAPVHAYKISKAALNMLNQQLALELADQGFTVALITPGWLKTELGSQLADLEVHVGVKAVVDIILTSTPEQNGKFLNIHVPGWEKHAPNFYDGQVVPW